MFCIFYVIILLACTPLNPLWKIIFCQIYYQFFHQICLPAFLYFQMYARIFICQDLFLTFNVSELIIICINLFLFVRIFSYSWSSVKILSYLWSSVRIFVNSSYQWESFLIYHHLWESFRTSSCFLQSWWK